MRRACAAVVIGAVSCSGHAYITWPPSRHGGTKKDGGSCPDDSCMWFSQITNIPGEPTVNAPAFRTLNVDVDSKGPSDWSRKTPWRAPGSAPVHGTGCGVAGGGTVPYDGTGPGVPQGMTQGQDAQTLPRTEATVWKAGTVQEVAWAISANHGGGYSWRLCRDSSADSPRGEMRGGPAAGDRVAAAAGGSFPTCVADATCKKQGCKKCSASPAWSCDECCAPCWKITQGDGLNLTGATCGCPPTDPPPPNPLNPDVTEECFQRTTLRFASNSSWIEWANRTRREFPLTKVTEGTFPAGSEWARNPIPGCYMCDQYKMCGDAPPTPPDGRSDDLMKYVWCSGYCDGQNVPTGADGQSTCPAGKEQFPALAGLSGYGHSATPESSSIPWDWNIVDKVHVPKDLEPGHYLLSWRWDCEQSPQIWQGCADVRIEL